MSATVTPAMSALAALLEARTGQQIAVTRSWRLETSLKPLLRARGLDTIEQLVVQLSGRDGRLLAEQVVDALLNNETSFYRDRAVFEMLDRDALALLHQARAGSRRLRIWSAGCSTGQEAYSLAIMLAGQPRFAGWAIDILGTDISGAAVERARAGDYSQFEIQRGLPVRDMLRWFNQSGERWTAAPALRRLVRFRRHNLLDRAPDLERFDLVLCRNVLLYFPLEVRTQVFERMAGAIAADGVLMLGAGETVLGQTDRFVSERAPRGLYRPVTRSPRIDAAARAA